MTNFVTACLLAVVWAAGDSDRTELKEDLAAIANAAPAAGMTQAHLKRIEQTWNAIKELPAQERVAWQNTFVAALMGSGRFTLKEDDPAQIVAATKHYREILAGLDRDAPAALRSRVQHALAAAMSKLASRMAPARRKSLHDEAVRLNTDAAKFFREAGDNEMLVSALGDLSLLYFSTADNVKARQVQKEALGIYESLPESFLQTVDLDLEPAVNERVIGWVNRGYMKQSEVYLLLALSTYNAGLKDPTLARESIYLFAESLRIGFVHRETTAVNNASLLLIQRNIGDQTGKARRIRQLFRILDWLPDVMSNPHWRNRDLTKTDESVRWIHARVRQYLGEFYTQTGQVLLARHNLNEAEKIASTLEDRSVLPLVLYTLADTWAGIGMADEALRVARQALDSSPSLGQRADILLLMGRVCHQQDEFERARDYHRWALDLFVKPGSFRVNASDLSVMAKIRQGNAMMQLSEGSVTQGLDALGEAANIAAIENPEYALQIQLDRLRAAQWTASPEKEERYHPATELAKALDADEFMPYRALAMTRGPNFSQTVKLVQSRPKGRRTLAAESLSLSAHQIRQIHSALRRETQADTSDVVDQTLREISDLQKRFAQKPPATYELVRLAMAQDEFDAAEEHLKEMLDTQWRTSQMNLDPTLGIESPERIQRAHHLGAVVAVRQGKLKRAIQVLDMSRHRALWQVHSSRQHVWDRLTAQERIEAALLDDARTASGSRLRQLSRQAAAIPRGGAALKRAQQQVDQTQQQLLQDEAQWQTFTRRIHKAYQIESPSMQPLETQDVNALLSDESVLLSFSVGDYETCVIAASRDGESVHYASQVLPIRRHELAALINALRIGCSGRDGRYRVVARELYRVLLKPLEDQIADAKLLVICPDGPLNVLPFSVLENRQGTPLLQRYPIAVIPSLALLRRLRDTQSEGREGALLVAMQNFDNRVWVPSSYAGLLDRSSVSELLPYYQLSDLQQTRSEVERIASLFENKSTVLINEKASESKVNSALEGKRYLHFATHGLIDSYNPFASALVLSAPGPDSREDGFLEASEILENSAFSGAELVTLSACESGLGLVQGGEGVLGLTWAFLAAGNRGVVSSLWNVDDDATAELMVGLYRELANGRNKAEALRSAALRVQANPKTSHAAYWAAFQFTGDWTNVP